MGNEKMLSQKVDFSHKSEEDLSSIIAFVKGEQADSREISRGTWGTILNFGISSQTNTKQRIGRKKRQLQGEHTRV